MNQGSFLLIVGTHRAYGTSSSPVFCNTRRTGRGRMQRLIEKSFASTKHMRSDGHYASSYATRISG